MTTPNPSFADNAAAASEHAERALSEATMYRPTEADETVDSSPVLAGHGVAYENDTPTDEGQAKDTVDLSDMPPLRDLSRELPGVRYGFTADAVEVIRLMPESLLKASEEDVDELTDGASGFDMSMLDKVVGMREVIPAAERYVLNMAENEDDMREWLIARGEVSVVMAAFNYAQAHAKN